MSIHLGSVIRTLVKLLKEIISELFALTTSMYRVAIVMIMNIPRKINNHEIHHVLCATFPSPEQELAQLIPDVGTSRIQEVPAYNGGRESTRIVVDTRAKLDQVELPPYTSGESPTSVCGGVVCGLSIVGAISTQEISRSTLHQS